MQTSGTMKPLTAYLGRLLGLFTLITSFWLLVERQSTLSTIPALLGDRPAMVIFAIIALAAGLAIVLAHNIWSGGALPILVTLIGWVMLIRGVFFLFLPPEATLHILAAMQFERLFYIYVAIPFVLGIYLTYVSFTSKSA
jgi:1,4-dihydroxy-2-naphthoate octaprenyltransferase